MHLKLKCAITFLVREVFHSFKFSCDSRAELWSALFYLNVFDLFLTVFQSLRKSAHPPSRGCGLVLLQKSGNHSSALFVINAERRKP